jgi:hypothetical protein
MSRPKTKNELIEFSQKSFAKLNELVDSYPTEEKLAEFPKGTMNRNIRDVLAHLHHWHLLMLTWYDEGMNDKKPEMPAKGYSWKTVPELNREIQRKYDNIHLDKIRKDLTLSFKQLQKVIAQHSNDELFEKKRFKWTGTTSLASYLISATSSHYEWAFKLIKNAKK